MSFNFFFFSLPTEVLQVEALEKQCTQEEEGFKKHKTEGEQGM